MKEYLERLKNPGTLIAVMTIVGSLLIQFRVNVDLDWLDTTTKLVCSLLVLLGVFNNPTTGGIDFPIIGKKDKPMK